MNDASHQTRGVSQLSTGRTGAPCCSQYFKRRNVIDDVDALGDNGAPSVVGMIARGKMPLAAMHMLVKPGSCWMIDETPLTRRTMFLR